MVIITPEDPRWKSSLESHRADLQYRIANLGYDVKRMDRLLEGWTEKPLEEC